MVYAGEDGDVWPAEELKEGEVVRHARLYGDVAEGAGDADELRLWRGERVEQGKGVVDARIEVEDELRHDSSRRMSERFRPGRKLSHRSLQVGNDSPRGVRCVCAERFTMIKFTRELLLGAYGFAVRPFRLSKLKGSLRPHHA